MPVDQAPLDRLADVRRILAATARRRTRPWIQRRFLRDYFDAGNLDEDGGTWKDTWWMGVPVRKCPTDLWLYQELVHELRPDVIIECGTAFGGSALYLGALCDVIGNGRVITIDTDTWDIHLPGYDGRRDHPRVTYLLGSSVDPGIVEQVTARIPKDAVVMVILDSDHSRDHVIHELRTYAALVTKGSMLIVEDTIVNGHPVLPNFGPGPMEALDQFLAETGDFQTDPIGDKFMISFNPRGYLRRIR